MTKVSFSFDRVEVNCVEGNTTTENFPNFCFIQFNQLRNVERVREVHLLK